MLIIMCGGELYELFLAETRLTVYRQSPVISSSTELLLDKCRALQEQLV